MSDVPAGLVDLNELVKHVPYSKVSIRRMVRNGEISSIQHKKGGKLLFYLKRVVQDLQAKDSKIVSSNV